LKIEELADLSYGAGHLVTTTFVQWPIWRDGKKLINYIENCSADDPKSLFDAQNTVSLDLAL